MRNGGDQIFEKLPNGTERRFENLIAHEKEIAQKQEQLIKLFKSKWCQDWFGVSDVEYLLRIFGKISINQHGIFSNSLEFIGDGLYLGASVFDHSCSPNAICVTKNGKEMFIRAIKEIENFSDVRLCYVEVQDTKGMNL